MIFLRVGNVGVGEKYRDLKITAEIFQHIGGTRRAAGVQQQLFPPAAFAPPLEGTVGFQLVIDLFHIVPAFSAIFRYPSGQPLPGVASYYGTIPLKFLPFPAKNFPHQARRGKFGGRFSLYNRQRWRG